MPHLEIPKPGQPLSAGQVRSGFSALARLAMGIGVSAVYSIEPATAQTPPPAAALPVLQSAAASPSDRCAAAPKLSIEPGRTAACPGKPRSAEEAKLAVKDCIEKGDHQSAVAIYQLRTCQDNNPENNCRLAFLSFLLQQNPQKPEDKKRAAQLVLDSAKNCRQQPDYPGLSNDEKREMPAALEAAEYELDFKRVPRARQDWQAGLGLTIGGSMLTVASALAIGLLETFPVRTNDYSCQYAMTLDNEPCVRYYREVTVPLLVLGAGSIVAGGVLLWKSKHLGKAKPPNE